MKVLKLIQVARSKILTSFILWHAVVDINSKYGFWASLGSVASQAPSQQFVHKSLCSVSERIALGCMVPLELRGGPLVDQHANGSNSTSSSNSTASMDLIQCAVECAQNGSCVGCSRNLSDWQVYQHWPCERVFPLCHTEEDEFYYMERTNACQNSGVWDETVKRCSCEGTELYVGEFCQRRARQCVELEASGYPGGYKHYILNFSEDGADVPVLCWLAGVWDNAASMTVYRRQHAELEQEERNYNLTWEEYETGFWETDTINGWVGLVNLFKILHYNNPQSLIMRVHVGDSKFEQIYLGFALEEETYALTYTSVSTTRKQGTIPEETPGICFSEVMKGSRFSTWDRDNDANPVMNCAAEAGGGWWFQSCSESCNLFLPAYDTQVPEPESYTKVRFPGIDVRTYADSFGPVALILLESLE
ncbi:angiopoietin-related protein 1-like [Elysia marginata]|uniref:Angiopoietin-related protein 1-like n=1 Tax=Elysia marginata TaxID=1093978 RepID=A0AAV4JEC5_9GAST|nr:angiopoietin-related protein 1-like [Elysia marginata]